MFECDQYNPDNVFKRFKVIEFPVSFVGLSTVRYLDVETDLVRSAYLKTTCDGTLMKFSEAREISPPHRAFTILQANDHTVQITFNPKTECISNIKSQKSFDNRFVFDLRLIQVDGTRCCSDELHSEIGRYYISGQYEFCKLSHYPKVIEFGDVLMNTEVTKHVRIRNESKLNATKIEYIKVTGFVVVPSKFLILPNSSKRISITIKPTCLQIKSTLLFEVRNPHKSHDDIIDILQQDQEIEDNFISYAITCKLTVTYKKITRNLVIESLHNLNEPDIKYTFINDEQINEHKKRKQEAFRHLQTCKSNYARKPKIEKKNNVTDKCYSDSSQPRKLPENFCKIVKERITTYSLFDVLFLPFAIDFGRIALNTYGEQLFTVKNNTKFEITIQLMSDKCIQYTKDRLETFSTKLNSFCETKIAVSCLGFIEGSYSGTFNYFIDNKFNRRHPYCLQVENPILVICEKVIKFGMITTESFITSVPVRIFNFFNIPVEYQWDNLSSEVPFDIIPSSGSIPNHSSKICDVMYICQPTKTKTHEIDFISQGKTVMIVPIELSVVTRKITIKFLQTAVLFKDIALNIETIERVKLENSSREIATFYVVEPLIPGLKIEPMSGNIRPKMVITFEIILKISCVMEFNLDFTVKINNKENITIPVSGNVVEPKIIIHPKNIYMTRIPCCMITYVPITFQNLSTLKTVVEVLDTGDENIFDVYIAYGNEKQRIFEFCVEGGQTKTVFIKVLDVFRREYDMFIPFKINGLLGPPEYHSGSTELQYYTSKFETQYENNYRVKIKSLNKDINYCRIIGVITVPWVQFSLDKFEIEYIPNENNKIDFTITNVSKYYLYVTIMTSKLSPTFSLDLLSGDNRSNVSESCTKFELDRGAEVALTLKFHPKMHGRYVSTAILFLDKHMTIPYSNLTFIGKRQNPVMVPSAYHIIFPPCYVGTSIARTVTVKMGFFSKLDEFSCASKDEPNLYIKFLKLECYPEPELYTLLTVEIKVSCKTTYTRRLMLTVNHSRGSGCEIGINFCFTDCPLTLHTNFMVKPEDNPFPYYPTKTQSELYQYMEKCKSFLEIWMFQQGFRRDLYPVIPDTFHAISSVLTSSSGTKSKGINVSYLNFIRRIAGPMMKHIRKTPASGGDESYKCVKEINDTYKEIIHLLRSRGGDLWTLQAKFLLSYEQFEILCENSAPKSNIDLLLIQELLGDPVLFYRLSKQSWIDFILQSYKVFVMDSCFFECVCVGPEPRDIVKVLIEWYNEQIRLNKLNSKKPWMNSITNLTKDLSDGTAISSALINYCPFLADQFDTFSKVQNDSSKEAEIINNACLIIEAMNLLRLYFPLKSKDFLEPNFLQMLFLSIHLYVVLPMFKPRDIIKFNPPLLRSSTRHVGVCPASQESLLFTYIILNNSRNNFTVEKGSPGDNGKKIFLNVKYVANFVSEENCILLVHGYNKTRIFDTYIVFILKGSVGSLNPVRKCKVTGPLYRPNKVDVLVSSPFTVSALFRMLITDIEPTLPVTFEQIKKPKFYLRRLHLIDTEITLNPLPKETGTELVEHKLYLQLMCLSTQVGNSWIWFRSEMGEFFIRITTQPRWDIAVDTLQAKMQTWPVDPCSCGEACECYRTTILLIPHQNELMVKALRYALLEHASATMMQIFDELIGSTTGKLILGMLLVEGGTNISDVYHILRSEVKYRISSKALIPRLDRVVLAHHTTSVLPLPVTVPVHDKSEKYTITFTSECGMDIRTYRIIFMGSSCCLSPSC